MSNSGPGLILSLQVGGEVGGELMAPGEARIFTAIFILVKQFSQNWILFKNELLWKAQGLRKLYEFFWQRLDEPGKFLVKYCIFKYFCSLMLRIEIFQ